MTRTAGAQIGCQRPSRFWGLGCPKIFHEAEDTLVFLCLCPAARPASAGPDRYGVCQGPEHDDPSKAAENRRPPAPDGTQSLAVLLGSIPLRQRHRSDPGQSQAAPRLVTPWINPITSGNVDTTDQTPVLRGRRICSVEKTSSRAPGERKTRESLLSASTLAREMGYRSILATSRRPKTPEPGDR